MFERQERHVLGVFLFYGENMPVKKEVSNGLYRKYHFLQLRVSRDALEGQVYSGEQVDQELSSWLQDGWDILNAQSYPVPIQPGQPFAGWYNIYHLAK